MNKETAKLLCLQTDKNDKNDNMRNFTLKACHIQSCVWNVVKIITISKLMLTCYFINWAAPCTKIQSMIWITSLFGTNSFLRCNFSCDLLCCYSQTVEFQFNFMIYCTWFNTFIKGHGKANLWTQSRLVLFFLSFVLLINCHE